MSKEKMTLHRALAELKLIDAKIEKQISEINPTQIKQKDKLVGGYIEEKDFNSQVQSKFDSINDLINRKITIKSAIVTTNGITKVTVAGKEMTIADAINMKAVVLFKKKLVGKLKTDYQQTIAVLNKNNEAVNANVQRILEATFGKENVKVTKDDMDAVRKPYIDANEFTLVDPLKVIDKVEEIEKEMGAFEADVDAALSEINAVTFIEI